MVIIWLMMVNNILWLVVEPYPSEKYDFVSWDDDIPNIWKNKIQVPNHQPEKIDLRWPRWNRPPYIRHHFVFPEMRWPWGVEHCYGPVMDRSKDVVQSMAMMDMKG